MKKKCTMAIGVLVCCLMIMASGAAWCGNYEPIPSNGTILDSNTGLFWLKNANCFGKQTWDQAMSSAASLKSGSCGLTDGSTAGKWRLPTIDELKARQKNQQGFNSVQSYYYWSGSTYSYDISNALEVGMNDGGVYNDVKTYNGLYVWPVRAGQ